MNYILAFLLFLLTQNAASDDSQNRRDISDSFDINIGAGYAVGHDQSSNNPPNGTSNISLSKNYYSNSINGEAKSHASVRGPRVLTNFTPQIGNPFSETSKNHEKSQSTVPNSGYKEHYSASSSNIHSYNAPVLPTISDEHFGEPNLVDFQKILNEVESKKPFSKILQVIKVPAIYEIHFQSDDNQKKVNLDTTGDWFWKNYHENKPNTTTQYFDDYGKWVNNAHWQEEEDVWKNNIHLQEEHLTQDGEKYYDFSDTPVVSYENLHDSYTSHDKPEGNRALQHTNIHHYSNTKSYPSFDNEKGIRINYNSDAFTKPSWINKDYPRNKKQPHAVNNFKRHVVYNPRGSVPTGHLLYNEIFRNYGSNIKNSASFKQNQVITENDKPQALHEVPAPFLGKYSQPKPFETQKLSDSYSKLLSAPTLNKQTKVKFDKLSPTTTRSPLTFNYKNIHGFINSKPSNFFGKNTVMKQGTFNKGDENLIYGTKGEHVLTPYEINIPVIPGSTMVTVTENPYNRGKAQPQGFQYSSTIKRNTYSLVSERPHILNTFNDHYKQVTDLHQHSSNRIDQTSEFPINEKDTFKALVTQQNTDRNNIFQRPSISANSIGSLNSEKPEILNTKPNNYHQVEEIPYQTPKTITIENISSTESSSIVPVNGKTFSTSTQASHDVPHNSQLEQTIKNDANNMDTVKTEQSLRRRVFNPEYNNFKKNRYMKNGYLKNSQYSRMLKRRSSGPHLDSIIYITRKSTN